MKDFQNLSELERLLYKELYRKSFYDFVKAFWNDADPQPYVDGKIVQFFCETFQYMCREWIGYEEIDIKLPQASDELDIIDVRQNKHNLCINIPPRHSKSMIFNVLAGVWIWTNEPIKLASVSHTSGLAGQMNSKRYDILNSEKFKFFFDEIELVKNSAGFLKDSRGGELYSIPRNAMTGYGADIIVNDDLTNAETARKDKEEMNNAASYYRNTMPSRINNVNKYVILNIQQRLAPNDITGMIMKDAKLSSEYTFITIPAVFSKHTLLVCPISGTVFEFQAGDPLWPERFGDYQSLKSQVGQTVWETQYLQRPISSDKTIIKENMIIEKDLPDTPGIDNADVIYASHDFPVKDKDSSDFLGSALGYRTNSTLYITDCLEKKMAFVKSVAYVKHLDEIYPGIIQIIEDKGNGSPILQQLQDEVAGMQAFQPGTASKTQRLESASLYMESGNVVLVRTVFNKETQKWELSEAMQNLKDRLLSFPFVEHDDIVDGFDMMILFVFMDRRYMVYGRAFNELNIINVSQSRPHYDYSTIFFNKEGDIWKALQIAVEYSAETKLIVEKEIRFKASVDEGLEQLKKFGNGKTVFIDCSATEALQGMYAKQQSVERYEIQDYDKSVTQLNLALSKKRVLLFSDCVLTKSDIENFKYSKSKDENSRYMTTKDGFAACLRVALHYYGGIV